MNISDNQDKLKKALQALLADPDFSKSGRSVHLLKFLFEKAINAEEVSEYMVGTELFENNYSNENSDSKVRVYMYNLRKKLKEYYLKNGKKEKIQFLIEKGQYNLTFLENKSNAPGNFVRPRYKMQGMPLIFLSLLLGILLGISLPSVLKNEFRSVFCWESFLKKNANNVCVVADHIVIDDFSNEELTTKFDRAIYTEKDYIDFLEQNPQSKIKLAPYTMITKMAPFSIKALNEWFLPFKANFSIRLDKKFELDELRDNNLIYIGQYTSMSDLRNIFLSKSRQFSIPNRNDGIVFKKDGIHKLYETNYATKRANKTLNPYLFEEYTIVSYMALERNKKAIFFSSNHDIGVMATVNNFTNRKWLKNFYKKNEIGRHDYFNALFKVSGINRSEMSCELVELEILPN